MATQPIEAGWTDSESGTNTKLPPRWLAPARVVWALVVVTFVGMNLWGRVVGLQHPEYMLDFYLSPADFFETRWIGEITYLTIVPIAYVATALVLFVRRSDDWMALFSAATLVGIGTVVIVETDVLLQTGYPDLLWLLNLIFPLPYLGFVALLFIFPDGRFVPRWSWPAFVVSGLAFVWSVTSGIEFGSETQIVAVNALSFGGLLFGLLTQVYRYRRVASATQRQQMKWVILGMGGPILTLVVLAAVLAIPGMSFGDNLSLYTVFLTPVMLAFPATLLASIMRFRLWDVDYVINRSLVYAIVTVLLAVTFGGVYIVLRSLLEALLGSEQTLAAVAVSTGAVALLFNPARRVMRRFVDRRVYGIQIDYNIPARQRAEKPQPTSRRTSIGNFTELEPTGSGGMAEVYRANHPTLNTTVAVKVLPARLSDEGAYRARFEREAQATARLKHPNIVQLHDFGVDEDGTSYMVMEYVRGVDLGAYLKQRGAMEFNETLPVLQGIAAALDYAHGEGLVHRDVKPSNVLLDQSSAPPRPVLSDFGIARIVTANTKLTATGGILGTFDYIAPEQIQSPAEVDGRADVYSLGVMAYQMLTGELPYHPGNPGAILMAHMMQPPPDASKTNPGVPRSAGKAILQAMAKSPDERFGTASAFVAALG